MCNVLDCQPGDILEYKRMTNKSENVQIQKPLMIDE
ncbi:MAG: hypothetical protein FWG61_01700 [Firmicutes bacterium]|nr:hypothetical protein [Bacillota bacterium]